MQLPLKRKVTGRIVYVNNNYGQQNVLHISETHCIGFYI